MSCERTHLAVLAVKACVPGAIGGICAACTYDFHALDQAALAPDGATEEGGGGAGDAGSGDDVGTSLDGETVDGGEDTGGSFDAAGFDATGCPTAPACFSGAIACSSTCTQQEQTCEGKVGCNLSPACIQKCKSDETGCKQTCVDTCSACTTDAGCPDPITCHTATE